MSIAFTNKLSTNPLPPKRRLLWQKAADSALGKNYDLSVVFVGDSFMKRLNTTYRDKPKPTNVLAFPISKTSGEIYLDIGYLTKEASQFDRTPAHHLDCLFVHGLFHLTGLDHGAEMERKEQRLIAKYFSH